MTTITVNKRTKAGKALLEMAKILSEREKGVSISNEKNEENPYNPEFVEKIRRSEKQVAEGKVTRIENIDEFWESLK